MRKTRDSLTPKERTEIGQVLSGLGARGSISFSGEDELRREIDRLSGATGIDPEKLAAYVYEALFQPIGT